jgi:7,8-dihydro-6-hydroxymethylpterin-pyrophosphokinase
MNFGIALGSNLGDRLAHLRSAIAGMLRTLPAPPCDQSPARW